MCLHSGMGNNNWLKQSLLWENKRPGSVASEGQTRWHSKHLNSHWLPGRRRAPSTSRSSPGSDRFTQPLGLGARMIFRSHLPSLSLQSHLFTLQRHGVSLTPVLCALTASNWRENAVLCQWLHIPPLNHCTVPLIHVTWANVHAGKPCPPLPHVWELWHGGPVLVGLLCWSRKSWWSSALFTWLAYLPFLG